MEPDRGCRCRDPKLSSWGRCLHCLGMVVCACLFLLGFLMCRLAVEYKDQYGTGQWLSSLAQGSAIMLVSLAGLADSVYATRRIGSNFGSSRLLHHDGLLCVACHADALGGEEAPWPG
eukprot:UN1929